MTAPATNSAPNNKPRPRRHPRAAAVRIITRVLADREPLDEALSRVVAEQNLDSSARAWLQDVCAGTLRWRGRLDQILDAASFKKKPTGWLRKVLIVAIYQIVAQDRVNPGAVVSETVVEIKRKEGEAPSRFANAVLRKLSEHAQAVRTQAFPEGAPASEQALWASLPDWIWNRLVAQYGLDWSRAYAQASLERPTVWIRSREPDFQASWASEAGSVPGSFRLTEGGSIVERPGFKEGTFFVQDISSQALIAEISAEVRKGLGEGPLKALDLCAAPGGKTAGLSWNGFEVIATDRPEKGGSRFALLEQTVQRVAPTARVIQRGQVASLEPLDLVWVDSPCTGSGILRRHPDVRWLRQERELASLQEVQHKLLKEAWDKVRPGGYLAYSVCSILKEEGPEALSRAQLGGTFVREWLLTPQSPPSGDGFYAALIRKA
ncbi:MAG: RsmB/NOP family class I SAM-dependent RNA methyltransferase [Bdellovibrionia bacterium]